MKIKGITFWEQHVEKMFAGVVGLGLLGAVAYQWGLQSGTVTVGKETVEPAKAFEPVAKAARELKGRLESGDPKLPEVPAVSVAERFEQGLAGPVSPVRELAAIGTGLRLNTDRVVEVAGDRTFAAVAVPAPLAASAHAFRSTIDPFEVLAQPDLKPLLPAEQPFDKAAASVEATFDGTALKAALQADPDGDGPGEALLQSWWRDVEILGVELERQERASDGSWSAATLVPTPPARINLLNDVAEKVKSIGDLPMVLGVARSAPDLVQRPPYYRTISGVQWKPPTEMSESGGETAAAGLSGRERLEARLRDIETRIIAVQEQIQREQDRRSSQTSPPPGRTGGGRMGGGEGPSRGGEPTKTASERALEGLAVRLDRARRELAEFDARQTGAPGAPATPGQPGRPGVGPDGRPIGPMMLDNPKVQVWAHDLSVEAGKEYRYRLRVVVNNPLFGRTASLKPEQAELAKDALARGAWSEWTEPTTVDPSEFYFITSASERDGVSGTRASAELFKFYYGYYRRGSVTVEPGDTLSAEMKLPDGLRIYDMTKLASANPGSAPQPEMVQPQPGPGRQPPRTGGGRMTRGGDEDPRIANERGEQPITTPDAPAVAAETPPADGSWIPAPKSMRMAVDAMLLDVAPVAIARQSSLVPTQEQGMQAFLRVAGGAIQVRLPEADRGDAAYQRLRANSEAGEDAAKAKPTEASPQINLPLPPPAGRRPGEQPPPGGGGGGGG